MNRALAVRIVVPAVAVLIAFLAVYFTTFGGSPWTNEAGLAEVREMAPATLVLDSATEVARFEKPEEPYCCDGHHARASVQIQYEADDAEAAFAEAVAKLSAQDWRSDKPVEGTEALLWGYPEAGPWVADVRVAPVNGEPGLEIYIWMIVD